MIIRPCQHGTQPVATVLHRIIVQAETEAERRRLARLYNQIAAVAEGKDGGRNDDAPANYRSRRRRKERT